jgi:hypothetical protein
MKSIYKFSTLILTIVVLNTMNTEGLQDYHTYLAADMTFNAQVNPPITHQQTKAQVELFRQALDKLGATSPEEVISIWASAEEMRNGVFHYAVACDELKSKIVNEWGEPKDNFWIIGGSSPWLERYEIVYNKKLNDSEYEAKLKFFWISSIGPSESTETTLIIIRNKDKWCVKVFK